MTSHRFLTALAGLNGFLAVAAGAFGAHAATDEAARMLLRTGAQYQLAAAAAALAILALSRLKGAALSAGLLLAGGLIFGLSLDAIVITGIRTFGAITPVGGVLMLAGFGWLAISALRSNADAL